MAETVYIIRMQTCNSGAFFLSGVIFFLFCCEFVDDDDEIVSYWSEKGVFCHEKLVF